MASKPRTKRKPKQTLKEFQAWLQGVEEIQPDGWAPNREQWILIRGRIELIMEEKPAPAPVPQPIQSTAPQPRPPFQPPTNTPSGFTTPPPVGGISVPVDVEMSPAAKQMLNPGSGAKAKTPDIDTSDGNVNSSFA